MIEVEEYGGHPTIVTPDLRLHFIRTQDQWRHRLDITSASVGTCVALSEEGTPDQVGPDRVVNPTFQQLHFQTKKDEVQALLVGQAGPYYFSAVFAVSEDDQGTFIDVELAGRNRGISAALASTYRMLIPGTDAINADAKKVIWRMDQLRVRLKFAAQVHPVYRTRITFIENDYDVFVRAGALNVGDPTQQWRYQWSCWTP